MITSSTRRIPTSKPDRAEHRRRARAVNKQVAEVAPAPPADLAYAKMLELWYRLDEAGRADILAYARKLLAEQEQAAGGSLLLAREAARALVLQATGLLNQALDVYDEASKSCTDDDITTRDHVVRARAALVRAMATPAQRAAEFKTALAMLARPPGANEGMINDALRQHVVERVG